MFMDIQYYPTGETLARRAAKLFTNRRISRLLEPSAGQGHLLAHYRGLHDRWTCKIDCIELDMANVEILRAKGLAVVHHDFLSFSNGAAYSHILLNPPFKYGTEHALKAWDVLFDGEMVAILNARGVEFPRTSKERHLAQLISQHGSVEYAEEAFQCPDTMRKCSVRIALVHLTKRCSFRLDFVSKLAADSRRFTEEDVGQDTHDIAVRGLKVTNLVTGFEAAVAAMREHVMAGLVASQLADRVGQGVVTGEEACPEQVVTDYVKELNERYLDLKGRAWRTVLSLTEVQSHLGTAARNRLESDFEHITELAFTRENVFGFLEGLVLQRSQLQAEMVCDAFDLFSRYHHKNAAYYQGWKSNTRHRQNAWKVKAKRLILPACDRSHYSGAFMGWSLGWEDARRFEDIDRVFAMLDGKHLDATFGLQALCSAELAALRQGDRLSSDYFDVRLYAGTGTWHLFPTRPDLIDRLNRVVGRHRAWMPDEAAAAGPAFWSQYEAAEAVAAAHALTTYESAALKRLPGDDGEVLALAARFERVLEEGGIGGASADFFTVVEGSGAAVESLGLIGDCDAA